MSAATHLKSLQALELAVRQGSFKGAAEMLGITPAAVGQRIRSLEDFLGTDLLLRGRSGLQPTRELELALNDLHVAFQALDRVTKSLEFQRSFEIHIVADADWSELWLQPRLAEFRVENPQIHFCINGVGDIPVRLGSPDLRITYGGNTGDVLFRDLLVPVTGPDNSRRIADWDIVNQMEGMPLLHLKEQIEDEDYPGWADWFGTFGHRKSGTERGVHYKNARLALEAVKQNVGFLMCGLSLMQSNLVDGSIVLPYPISQHILAPQPFRLTLRPTAAKQLQLQKFIEWLRAAAHKTQTDLDALDQSGQL